jgi:hypothetical protein
MFVGSPLVVFMLIQIHQNQWVHEPIKVASTYNGLLIQALIYYQPTKTIGQEPPNGGDILQVCTWVHLCLL